MNQNDGLNNASSRNTSTTIGVVVLILVLILLFVGVGDERSFLGNDQKTNIEILAQDSGETLEVKKETILKTVSKDFSKITEEEKVAVMRAIEGTSLIHFEFTDDEIDLIYAVINN